MNTTKMLPAFVLLAAMMAFPATAAPNCTPPGLNIVCAEASTAAWDVAESQCGGYVGPRYDCWYSRVAGQHSSDTGELSGDVSRAVQGSIIGRDSCLGMWSCQTNSRGVHLHR